MPGVSLPTVYATLDLLEELGLVRRVATEGGTVVYDPRIGRPPPRGLPRAAAHRRRRRRVDPSGVMAAAQAAGFALDHAQLVLRGLCADCRQRD